MTYTCTLIGYTAAGTLISVDFNGTFNAGSGPRYSLVDEDITMDAPIDSEGKPQDMPMEMKYSKTRVLIAGQFTDGWGGLNWMAPTTKAEKLIALQKFAVIDTTQSTCMTLNWPTTGKTMKCKFDRLDISEQANAGNTIGYDISLQITG
jgi:hypothetical protein